MNYKVKIVDDKNWYENQPKYNPYKIDINSERLRTWELMMLRRLFFVLLIYPFSWEIYLTITYLYQWVFIDIPHYITNIWNSLCDYYFVNNYALIFISFLFYFINILVLSFITYYFGVHGVFVVSGVSILVFWLCQFYFFDLFFSESITISAYFEFLNYTVGTAVFSFALKIDFISYCFLFLTTSIGLCAVIYSLSYFKNEPHTDRFILLLNWFIISMALLVTADNVLLLFLGWELIGLTSFLLINFWTLRRNTLKAAMKAFTFNKVSDIALLVFIITISHQTGSLSLSDWLNYFSMNDAYTSTTTLPLIFLIVAASIKSAQIVGHLWLPDSMEAPIPASALIHSATLVSAGVYLLLRFDWLIKGCGLSTVLMFLGAITALYGAVVSAAQTDCKKLLAYSTISHCGFLFVAVGIGNLYLTVTYLYLHGFFKALTFFCVGNLVKVSRGYQDSRKMGQLALVLPVESILLVVCAINLGALPLTVGYFYKSLLQAVLVNTKIVLILLPLLLIAMLSSVIYVFRLVFYTLFDIQKGNNTAFDQYFDFNYNDEEYSNTTTFGTLFVFLLLALSMYVYSFYLLFFDNFAVYTLCTDLDYLESIQVIKQNNFTYFYYFYIFFAVVTILIMTVECRREFSYLKKFTFFYYFFLFIAFLQLILYLLVLFS